MRGLVRTIAGVFVFLGVVGLSLSYREATPENAQVYVVDGEYLSTPCYAQAFPELKENDVLPPLPIAEARRLKYKPNDRCRNADGFIGGSWSMLRHVSSSLGIVARPTSRWNPDGSWNW